MLIAADICCCGCDIPTIAVWNDGAAVMDNFKVLLNGTDIGHIDNSSGTITGRIFSTDTAITVFNHPVGLVAAPSNFEPTLLLNRTLLITGLNTLRVESISDSGHDCFADVRVDCISVKTATSYSLARAMLVSSVTFPHGVGNGQTRTFTYTP
jgi:hypothetical protein